MEKHAFILSLDIERFSELPNADQLKLVMCLYQETKSLLEESPDEVLDKKTVGDGFLIYFGSMPFCIRVALLLQRLFTEMYVWEKAGLERSTCRIALHHGDLTLLDDAIEERYSLFGKSITTAARLEPVVRPNEVWCTNSFHELVKDKDLPEGLSFEDIGECELAKNAGKERVWALYGVGAKVPRKLLFPFDESRVSFPDDSHSYSYFIFIRLRDKYSGDLALRHVFKLESFLKECPPDSTYYIYGDYDVLLRIRSKDSLPKSKFIRALKSQKIITTDNDCLVFAVDTIFYVPNTGKKELRGEKAGEFTVYRLNLQHDFREKFFKAFIFLESTKINGNTSAVKFFVEMVKKAVCKEDESFNVYVSKNSLIIEIMFKTQDYYGLSSLVEKVEKYLSDKKWNIGKSITYPVHGFDENPKAK